MKNEQWLKERYDALPAAERARYSFISMKLKRFRTFNRLFGREMGDMIIREVYETVLRWLQPDEYIAHINLNYYNLLVRLPRDYDALFHAIIELNRQIRDTADDRFRGQIFTGFGVFPLTEVPVDFYTAQYNADICRVECPESSFRNSHLEIYGITYKEADPGFFDPAQAILPAIERGEFKLYLQPKVDLRTGEVSCAEALIRWNDPNKGLISPGDFLPSLEEAGLLEQIDYFVFDQICQHINRWYTVFGKKIHISVNLSRTMFNYRYYFEEYKKIHQKYNTPKDCIEFELLESIVLNQVDRVREVVDELHDYGFRYSLDDFGSGYSSFSVLTNTDFSFLKIDRSLFRDETNQRERAIIRHIIATAHELNMQTVAEGVESMGYVKYLQELGCEYVQGYVFYRPMPVEEFEARFVQGSEHCEIQPLAVKDPAPGPLSFHLL